MKRSWICAAAVAVFQRMAGARRVSSIRTSVVLILFLWGLYFSFLRRSGRKRSSSVRTMLRTASTFTSQDALLVTEADGRGARRRR